MQNMSSKSVSNRIAARDSNIELLRIISMFMIVAHHLFLHGGIFENAGSNIANLLWGGYFCRVERSDMTVLSLSAPGLLRRKPLVEIGT